jgi:hypothetical protein
MKNKYSHLINQKIITVEDLQLAQLISQGTNRNIEGILIIHFGISRINIGRALSRYYGCSFRAYDSNLPIPLAFLTGLNKSNLLNECWAPYRWGKDGIEVLVEDPWNFTKNDRIRVYLKTEKIKFSVAIKEDIEDFIHRLFKEKQKLIFDYHEISHSSFISQSKCTECNNQNFEHMGDE